MVNTKARKELRDLELIKIIERKQKCIGKSNFAMGEYQTVYTTVNEDLESFHFHGYLPRRGDEIELNGKVYQILGVRHLIKNVGTLDTSKYSPNIDIYVKEVE